MSVEPKPDEWFYDDAGTPRGPVSRAKLSLMVEQGWLTGDSLVRSAGAGPDWVPASQAGFAPAVRAAATPPPLPSARSASPVAVQHGQPLARLIPPQPAEPTPTGPYALLIAIMPLFVLAADIGFGVNNIDPFEHPVSTGLAFWSFVLSLVWANADSKRIAAAGLNPQNRALVPFMLLTPIGYFIRRRSVAGTSLAPVWLWIGCSIIYLMLAVAIFAPTL